MDPRQVGTESPRPRSTLVRAALALATLALAALALAGCVGNTDPATHVGVHAATLNAYGKADGGPA